MLVASLWSLEWLYQGLFSLPTSCTAESANNPEKIWFCLIWFFTSQSTNVQSCRDWSSCVEPVLRRGYSVLLKDTTQCLSATPRSWVKHSTIELLCLQSLTLCILIGSFISCDGSLYITKGDRLEFPNYIFFQSLKVAFYKQTVQTLMKWCILHHFMHHFIWVLTLCQGTYLWVSSRQGLRAHIKANNSEFNLF